MEPKVHPLQEPTTTNQVDALDDEILRQLRRSLGQTAQNRIDHRRNWLLDCRPDLRRGQGDRLRESAHQFTATHFGVDLVVGRER